MSASIEKGRLLLTQARYRLAETELRKALAEDPENSTGHALLALALSGLNQFPNALKQVDKAIHLSPKSSYPHYVKSTLLGGKARLKEALVCLQEALRLNPHSADYLEYLSKIYFAQGNWSKALEAAEKGLEIDPENRDCRKARTQALIKLGRRDEAAVNSALTLSANPEDPEAHAQRGFVLLEEGRHAEALRAFEESMRLDPSDPQTRAGLTMALKSRYPLYGWLLKYFLWTEKLQGRTRTALGIGFFILLRMVEPVGKTYPQFQTAISTVILGLVFLVAGTWLSDHFFNLVLCLTSTGRAVLGDDKVLKYKCFGSCLFISLVFFVAAYFTQEVNLMFGGILNLFLMIPLASVFQIAQGKYRNWMWAYTAFTAFCGAASLSIYIVWHPEPLSGWADVSFLFIFGFILGILLSRIPGKYLTRKALEG